MTLPAQGAGPIVPGDRIAGKYDVVRVVGEGGMGVVYEALHTRLQQRVAIKMLQPRVLMLPDVVARFEREARAACRLRSRYAVRILDVDHDAAGRAYMVMEYLEGHDLSQEIDARGRLRVGEAVDVVLMACAAMAEAHASGVVHRDLKPSNLFLVREGTKRIVKLLDFGISKITSDSESNVTSTFATMGTPLYMSPEQIRSAKNVDGRTDVWSLGVILYEALAGARPFQGTTTAAAAAIVADPPPPLRAQVPDVPVELEGAVMRALEKRPDDRFADVRALAEAIAPFASTRDLVAEVQEAAVPRTMVGTSAAPLPRTPSSSSVSSPSFVSAPTVAQPTPPASRPLSPLAASLERFPSAANASSATSSPSTQGAWSERAATRGGRATRVGIVLGVAAIVGGVAGIVVARGRAAPTSTSTSTSSVGSPETSAPAVIVAPPAVASAPSASASSSVPIAGASASAPSAPASSAPSVAVPSASTSPRMRGRPAPTAPPAHTATAAPSATHATPPPAATNPVHL